MRHRKPLSGLYAAASIFIWISTCATSAAAEEDCYKFFSVTGGVAQGLGLNVAIKVDDTPQTTPLDSTVVTIGWNETGSSDPPTGDDDDFLKYFTTDTSTDYQWNIKLENSLEDFTDYPSHKNSITATATFTGFPVAGDCRVQIIFTIKDENTQDPEFKETSYTADIKEDYPVLVNIIHFQADIIDLDGESPNNDVTVTIDGDCPVKPETSAYHFEGQYQTVNFQLTEALDFEKTESYSCNIVITDGGNPPRSTSAPLKINVEAVSDEPPLFTSGFYYVTVNSLEPEGELQPLPGKIEAIDGDLDTITYSMVDARSDITGTDYFTIDENSGVVSHITTLVEDILSKERISFILTATDSTAAFTTSVLEVTLPPVPTTTPTTPTPSTTLSTTEFTCPPCTTEPWTTVTTSTCEPCPTTDTPCPTISTTERPTCPPCTTIWTTECPTCPSFSTQTTDHGTECPTCPPCTTVSSGTECPTSPTTCPPCSTVSSGTECPTSPTTCPPCSTVSSGTECPTSPTTCPPCSTVSSGTECPTAPTTCPPCSTVTSGTECPTAPTCPPCSTVSSGTGCPTAPTCPPCSTVSAGPTTEPEQTLSFKKDAYSGQIYPSFSEVYKVEVEGTLANDAVFSLDGTSNYFEIDSKTGEITIKAEPPVEIYSITARAKAEDKEATTTVNIEVLPSASDQILLTNSLYLTSMEEEVDAEESLEIKFTGKVPGTLCISNVEPDNYADFFSTEKDGEDKWHLKKTKGHKFDFEDISEVRLKLQAFEEEGATCSDISPIELLRSEAMVVVTVLPVDDNPPKFVVPSSNSEFVAYPKDIALQKVAGPVLTIQADDEDAGSVIEYSMKSGATGFTIENLSGAIYVEGDFDCQENGCQLNVVATDGGGNSDEANITVKSLDMAQVHTITLNNVEVSEVDDELRDMSSKTNIQISKLYVNPTIKLNPPELQASSRGSYYGLRRPSMVASRSRRLSKRAERNSEWQIQVNVYAVDSDGTLLSLEDLNQKLTDVDLDEAVPFVDEETFSPSPVVESTTGLKVAVGILAGLLGIILIAAGFLVYRKRRGTAQKKPKNVSTLGSAYPNHSYSEDGSENKSTFGKKSNGLHDSIGRIENGDLRDELRDSPPLHRSGFSPKRDSPIMKVKNDTQQGLRRLDTGTPEFYSSSSPVPPPSYTTSFSDDLSSAKPSSSSSDAAKKSASFYPSLTSKPTSENIYENNYIKAPKKAPPPLTSAPAKSILRGTGGASETKQEFPLTSVSHQKAAPKPPEDPETDYDQKVKTSTSSSSKFSALKGSPILKKSPKPLISDSDEEDTKSVKSHSSVEGKKSNLKTDYDDPDSDEEKKSVAFKVLVDTKEIEAENQGPSQKAAAVAAAKSDAIDILQANKKKLEEEGGGGSDDDDENEESSL